MVKMSELPDTHFLKCDMCEFGLRVAKYDNGLARKPTGILTKVRSVAEAVDRRCAGNHHHEPLIGNTAAAAAKYTSQFCDAVLRGLRRALARREILRQPRPHRQMWQSTEIDEVTMDQAEKVGELVAATMEEYLLAEAEVEVVHRANQGEKCAMTFPAAFDMDPIEEVPEEEAEAEAEAEVAEVAGDGGEEEEIEQVEGTIARRKSRRGPQEDEPLEELSPEEERALAKIHCNLGHAPRDIMARALKHAGAKPRVIRWCRRRFRCAVCDARPRPMPARPGMLPRCLKFNHTIGLDLFFFEFEGQEYTFLNVVD